MQSDRWAQAFINDFRRALKNYRQVIPFIRKHRLWTGLDQYGWVMWVLIFLGTIISLKFVGIYDNWLKDTSDMGISLSAFGGLVRDVAEEGYQMFKMSGFKYIILVLLEVVIFHFARKTHQILSKEDTDAGFDAFVEAQIRMIKVVIFSFIMESVFSLLAGTALSIVGLGLIKPAVIFVIQCFFLGFTFIDNYNEIHEMPIKESFRYTRQFSGAAIAIGIVVYVLMLLPVLGALFAPLLGAVTATITMFELEQRAQKPVYALDRRSAPAPPKYNRSDPME